MYPRKMLIKHWYHQIELRYQFVNRAVRAIFLRLLLKLFLPVFKIERQFRQSRQAEPKRILVIVIGGLGDCLLFDPLFRCLKEKWPGSCVDVLSGSFEQMWACMASVDNLLLLTPSKFKTPWAYLRLFRIICLNRYDIVAEGISFLPMRGIYPILTSLIFKASGAAIRIGRNNTGRIGMLRQPELGFIGRKEMLAMKRPRHLDKPNPYLTHLLDIIPPDRRSAHESAFIFEPIGLPFHRNPEEPLLCADPPNDAWAVDMLRSRWATPNDIIVGVTLETTRRIKTWPLINYIELMKLGLRDGLKFVILGLDTMLSGMACAHFAADSVMDLCGQTSLGQMIATIRQCDVFLSADTGSSHVAQACRVPTVVLFGPSNEKEFGPADLSMHTLLLPPEQPSCRPCVLGPCVGSRSCIQSITTEQAYAEVKQKADAYCRNKPVSKPQTRVHPQNILCVI